MTTWGRDAAQSHEGRGLTRCVAHPDTRQGRTGPDAGVACGKRLAGLADDNRVALSDRVSVVLKPFSDARATAHAMRRKKMRAAIPRAPARLGSWHSKRQYRVSSFPEGPRGWLLSPLHRHVQEYLASLRQDGSADLGRMLSSTRKRLRTPSASPSTPAQVVVPEGDGDDGRPDIIGFLTERSQKIEALKQELSVLKFKSEDLTRLLAAEQDASARLRSRLAAAEDQLTHRRSNDPGQDRMDKLLRSESELRALAERAQVAAEGRAQRAEQEARALRDALAEREAALAAREATESTAAADARVAAAREEAAREAAVAARRAAAAEATAAGERAQRVRAEAAAASAAQEAESWASRASAAEVAAARAEARAAAAEAARGAGEGRSELEALVGSLRKEMEMRDAEVEEARRIRKKWANTELLREKLSAAEARAAQVEPLLARVVALEAEVEQARRSLRPWEEAARAVGAQEATPAGVRGVVAQKDRLLRAAQETVGRREEELASERAAREAAQALAREAEARAASATLQASAAEEAAARAQATAGLLRKEREGLVALVATYGQEDADAGAESAGVEGATARSKAQAAHIARLQEQLGHSEDLAHSLQTDLDRREVECARLRGAVAAAEAKAREREREAAASTEEAARLAQQVALVESRLGQGLFDPATTRVLHLRDNPESAARKAEAEDRAALLEAENRALRAQLDAAGTGGAGAAAAAAAAVADAEKVVAERRVREAEKRLQRLQEVFKDRIGAFKEACAVLFGYRVEMTAEGAPGAGETVCFFTLRPRLASSPANVLTFRFRAPYKAADMELVPSDFSKLHQREVDTFIVRFKNVAAFTANLTMDLFQKETQT